MTGPTIPEWLRAVPRVAHVGNGFDSDDGEWVRLADVVAAAQPIQRALIQVIQERDAANAELERNEARIDDLERMVAERQAELNGATSLLKRITSRQQTDLTALRAATAAYLEGLKGPDDQAALNTRAAAVIAAALSLLAGPGGVATLLDDAPDVPSGNISAAAGGAGPDSSRAGSQPDLTALRAAVAARERSAKPSVTDPEVLAVLDAARALCGEQP